jgi:hypothetical protein
VSASDFRSKAGAGRSAGFSLRRPLLVLARSDVHFALVDLANTPPKLAEQALRIKVRSLSPDADFAFCYRLPRKLAATNSAEVWFWNRAALASRAQAAGRTLEAFVVVPESALGAINEDGIYLLSCAEGGGYEAQAVSGGQLQRSRWFAAMPSDADWQAFLRDARADTALALPTRAQPMRLQPLSINRLSFGSAIRPASPVALWAASAVLAAVGALAIGMGVFQYRVAQELERMQVEVDAGRGRNKEVLNLERKVTSERAAVVDIALLDPGVSQSALLAHFAQVGLLSVEQGVTLNEWDYRNKRLRLAFDVPLDNFVLSDFLRQLEKVAILSNVRLLPESGPRQVVIQADVALAAQGALKAPPAPPKLPTP